VGRGQEQPGQGGRRALGSCRNSDCNFWVPLLWSKIRGAQAAWFISTSPLHAAWERMRHCWWEHRDLLGMFCCNGGFWVSFDVVRTAWTSWWLKQTPWEEGTESRAHFACRLLQHSFILGWYFNIRGCWFLFVFWVFFFMQNVSSGSLFRFYQTFQNQATIYFTDWKWNYAKIIFFQWKHKKKPCLILSPSSFVLKSSWLTAAGADGEREAPCWVSVPYHVVEAQLWTLLGITAFAACGLLLTMQVSAWGQANNPATQMGAPICRGLTPGSNQAPQSRLLALPRWDGGENWRSKTEKAPGLR